MKKSLKREQIILNQLKISSRLETREVMQLLNISKSTVLRIFADMEKRGLLVRVFGGVQLAAPTMPEYSFIDLEHKQLEEKRKIANSACNMIEDTDIIFLDCGTTTYQLAIALCERLQQGELRNLQVLTNSIANMQILAEYCDVILIGGNYRPHRKDVAGVASVKFLSFFYFTQSFIGADGISLADGFMTTDLNTAHLDEMVIARSTRSIVLADSSKFGRSSFIGYASPDQVDLVITDTDFDEEEINRYQNQGFRNIVRA